MRSLRLKPKWQFIFLVFLLAIPGTGFAKNINGKEVIIVSSYHPEYLWAQLVNAGMVTALTGRRYSSYISKELLDSVKEFEDSIYWMRSKYLTTDAEKRKAAEPIIKAIEERKPDIVIVADDNATSFIIPHFLNTDIRFIFCGVNGDPRDYGLVSTETKKVGNVTGLLERYPFNELLTLIKRTVPERSDLYVMYDDTETGQKIMQDFNRTIQTENTKKLLKTLGLNVRRQLISNDWEEWKRFIESIQNDPKAILFVQTFYATRNKQNKVVDYTEVVKWIRSHSRVPEFGHSGFQINLGFMATVGTDAAIHGYEAGTMATKLIHDVPIADLPISIPAYTSINVNKTRVNELKVQIPFDILSSAFVYEDPQG